MGVRPTKLAKKMFWDIAQPLVARCPCGCGACLSSRLRTRPSRAAVVARALAAPTQSENKKNGFQLIDYSLVRSEELFAPNTSEREVAGSIPARFDLFIYFLFLFLFINRCCKILALP